MIEERVQIKQHLRDFAMLWDDTRASQDVAAQFGLSGVQIFESTPQSIQAAHTSPEKTSAMGHLIEAFGLVKMTRPFRTALMGVVSAAYNIGLPSEYALDSLAVRLNEDDLGVFEQGRMQETERAFLAVTIKQDSLHLIVRLGFMIPEEIEAQMTHKDAAEALNGVFHNQEYGWVPAEVVERKLDQLYEGRFRMWREDGLKRLGSALDWADIYGLTYSDNTFVESADLLRPVVRIYMLGEKPEQRNPAGLEITE
ncbi:hypothetical protein HYW44_00760 [Candidatus Daviesbacteria bacterium]|nr:hypothetical protein [Candidatus Daviesbacteria bacterium]